MQRIETTVNSTVIYFKVAQKLAFKCSPNQKKKKIIIMRHDTEVFTNASVVIILEYSRPLNDVRGTDPMQSKICIELYSHFSISTVPHPWI